MANVLSLFDTLVSFQISSSDAVPLVVHSEEADIHLSYLHGPKSSTAAATIWHHLTSIPDTLCRVIDIYHVQLPDA